MSEQQQQGGTPAPPAQPEADRIKALETRQEAQDAKLDRILAAVGGGTGDARQGAQGAVQGRLAAPGDLTAQIQEELDRRDQATKAEADRAATGSRIDALERAAAARSDRAPRPAVRKVTRFMFGPADE